MNLAEINSRRRGEAVFPFIDRSHYVNEIQHSVTLMKGETLDSWRAFVMSAQKRPCERFTRCRFKIRRVRVRRFADSNLRENRAENADDLAGIRIAMKNCKFITRRSEGSLLLVRRRCESLVGGTPNFRSCLTVQLSGFRWWFSD